MRFARRRDPDRGRSAVELTPLIDVVLLLLIFFMVSTTFERDAVLAVELPEADGVPSGPDTAEITVSVAADGAVAVNDQRLADGEVDTVAVALASAAGSRVLVAADGGARHDAVVRVLDAAGRSGLTEVRILTKRPPGIGLPEEDADGGY